MKVYCNRAIPLKPNIMEIQAEEKKKPAWMKVAITDDLAKALMLDWMGSNIESSKIDNAQIVWTDKAGLSFSTAGESLEELLTQDILNRYDSQEYYDDYLVYEGADQSTLTENILDRYDNREYWDKDIAREYLDNDYVSDDDAELIKLLVSYEDIAEILLSAKSNP